MLITPDNLQTHTLHRNHTATAPPPTMFPFLSLPREIRDLIYEQALRSPQRPEAHLDLTATGLKQLLNPPSLGLLLANKQTRSECLKIGKECHPALIQRNTWRIIIKATGLKPDYTRYSISDGDTIYPRYGHMVQSVFLDWPKKDGKVLRRKSTGYIDDDTVQDDYDDALLITWHLRKRALASLPNLRRLDLELEHQDDAWGSEIFAFIYSEIVAEGASQGVQVHLMCVDDLIPWIGLRYWIRKGMVVLHGL